MMVDMTFKRVTDFHGHLCPDLVLGAKLCEYIQQLLAENQSANGILNIIAENCTSALDAIQIMLGATLGNQRLKIMDFGKHNYTIITRQADHCYRFSLKQQQFGDEDEYNRLAQKIEKNNIGMDEVMKFRGVLDQRVKWLLNQAPESLFKLLPIKREPQPTETAGIYLTCCCCREQVLASHVVEYWKDVFCIPCFQKMNLGCTRYRLH
jgi:formylmethanofuran dehydrogenase subunit E